MQTDTEHSHQVTFVNWFRQNYPDCIIFAIPNGDLRNMHVAKRLKTEGVLSGVPDLCCLLPNLAVWIEMKKEKGGTVSKSQKEMHLKMEKLGHKVNICKGYEEAIICIENYINLIRI